MFEKEAEEHCNETQCANCGYNDGIPCINKCHDWQDEYDVWQDGAEFGYNKANEWHYVKDGDLPKHENYVLVSNGKDWTKGFYKDNRWHVISLVGFLNVIAWKEIILPKEVSD